MQGDSSPRGVRGWLLVLVLWLLIFGPLRTLLTNWRVLSADEVAQPALAGNAAWVLSKRWTWIVWSASAVISMTAGYRLWRHPERRSVNLAVFALWAAGPLAIIGYLAVSPYHYSQATTAVWASLIGTIALSCIFAAGWTIYLRGSRRVAATYFVDEHLSAQRSAPTRSQASRERPLSTLSSALFTGGFFALLLLVYVVVEHRESNVLDGMARLMVSAVMSLAASGVVIVFAALVPPVRRRLTGGVWLAAWFWVAGILTMIAIVGAKVSH